MFVAPDFSFIRGFTWADKKSLQTGGSAIEKESKLSDAERQPCEIWTRVMGYFRPVSEFNIGKKAEYAERVCFKESAAVKTANAEKEN